MNDLHDSELNTMFSEALTCIYDSATGVLKEKNCPLKRLVLFNSRML